MAFLSKFIIIFEARVKETKKRGHDSQQNMVRNGRAKSTQARKREREQNEQKRSAHFFFSILEILARDEKTRHRDIATDTYLTKGIFKNERALFCFLSLSLSPSLVRHTHTHTRKSAR